MFQSFTVFSGTYGAPSVHSIRSMFFFVFTPTQKHTTERKSKQANTKINDQTQKCTVKRKNKESNAKIKNQTQK